MKGLFVLFVVVGGVVVALKFTASSVTEGFDPAEQGREARAAVQNSSSWTEVLDRLGDPSRWRNGTSDFDFSYVDNDCDAATLAVNFDRTGKFTNVQDKEGKGALMDAAGG